MSRATGLLACEDSVSVQHIEDSVSVQHIEDSVSVQHIYHGIHAHAKMYRPGRQRRGCALIASMCAGHEGRDSLTAKP